MALTGLAVLALGWVTAPRTQMVVPLTAPEERTAPLLEAELARRRSLDAFDRVQELGNRVVGYSVRFAPAPPREPRTRADLIEPETPPSVAGLGVVISSVGLVLTHVAALDDRTNPTFRPFSGMAIQAAVTAYEPSTGLVLLTGVGGVDLPAAPMSTRRPAAGSISVASGRGPDFDVIAPVTVASATTAGYRLSGADALPPGTPLYDADGALFAIAGTGGYAYAATEAIARLHALEVAGQGVPMTIGAVLQPIGPALVPWFGERGVIVADVRRDGGAARALLQRGDVVTEVAGGFVDSIDDVRARLSTAPRDQLVPLHVMRDGKPLDIEVEPESALLAYGVLPPASDTGGARLAARDVLSPEQLVEVDLSGDALILEVNGRTAATAALATRDIARARGGVLLYVENAGERYFVALGQVAR